MNRLRNAWFARQGLGESEALSPAEVASRYGWLRSVGSANPYLAIHARSGADRATIEAAVAEASLVEVPAARGCTYYVPKEDAAVALRLAAMGTCGAEFRMAERHLGVTDGEVAGLADVIARVLEEGSADPRALSSRVEPRHLGEAGKKRGLTSTLSLGLSRLQVEGRIRRLPQGGRLDTERFRYTLWTDGPKPGALDDEALAETMAQRYFRWAGPATEAEYREFTGLPAKLAKSSMRGLVSIPDDPQRFLPEGAVDAYLQAKPAEGVRLLASLDPWIHFRRNLPTLLDDKDCERSLPDGKGLADAHRLRELDSHPIVVDGAVAGMWEFDPEAGEIVAWCWRPRAKVDRAVVETGAWIAKELGDFRSFSLDSPASRRPRLEVLRQLASEAR